MTNKKEKVGNAFCHIYLIVLSLIAVFPLVWVLLCSVKSSGELTSNPTRFFPKHFTLENFTHVIQDLGFAKNIGNSLIIAIITTGIAIVISSMAAYGIVRFFPKLGSIMSKVLVATYMFPPILLAIPYSMVMAKLGLVNTRIGLIIVYLSFSVPYGFTLLEGSDTLNASIKNESPISRVKYVNNNSILTDTEENHVFKKFINFVDHMLLFYSLDSRGYEGFMNGSESIAEGIVNSGKVKDFENFMRENGIEYNIGISGWNKHHLFLSMSLTHFIILSFLSQCKKDLEKFQGYRYLLQRTIQI